MCKEIEEIKKILIKYDPITKEALDTGLVGSKSVYDLEESLNEITKGVHLDIMDIVLVCKQLQKLEKKKYCNCG